jgi:hypothetical protein
VARAPHAPRLAICVGQGVIDEGVTADSSHCMIAEAIKAAVPNARSISVDLQTVRFTDPERKLRFTYLTPRVAQVALINFDQGVAPRPFRFQLRDGQVTTACHATRRALGLGRKDPLTGAEVRGRVGLSSDRDDGSVPEVMGGQPPPIGPLSNVTPRRRAATVVTTDEVRVARRRAFGLRAMSRGSFGAHAQSGEPFE